jgi:hypothetical protein
MSSLTALGAGGDARHMRGLAEKIWKVLAPIRAAVSAEFSSDLAMEVWAPIRKRNLDSNRHR